MAKTMKPTATVAANKSSVNEASVEKVRVTFDPTVFQSRERQRAEMPHSRRFSRLVMY